MIYTTRTRVYEQPDGIEFGVTDKRGRVVGARVSVCTDTFVDIGCGAGWTQPPGTYYGFAPSATRDGEGYGASQPIRYFDTRAERDAAIEKYLAAAAKRAHKQFPGA